MGEWLWQILNYIVLPKIENVPNCSKLIKQQRNKGDNKCGNCEHASCYAHANLPRTVPKSYWSWPVAICEESVLTCTMVSSNTLEVHVPRHLYACPVKTEVPD